MAVVLRKTRPAKTFNGLGEKDEKDEKRGEKKVAVMIMIMPYCHLMESFHKTITKKLYTIEFNALY